jgi:hypothetical protein
MEYEESIGSVEKNADFHVLEIFIAKKHDLSEKKFSVCHAPLSPLPPLPPLLEKFGSSPQPSPQ